MGEDAIPRKLAHDVIIPAVKAPSSQKALMTSRFLGALTRHRLQRLRKFFS